MFYVDNLSFGLSATLYTITLIQHPWVKCVLWDGLLS